MHRMKRTTLWCDNPDCRREFVKISSDVSACNYCSRSCAVSVNNKKFPKRGTGPRMCARAGCKNIVGSWLKYCSSACRRGVRQKFTKEKLVGLICAMAYRLGRTPARREASDIAFACVYYFGSWNAAITAAGLIPNRSHSQRMYHRTMTKAKDGHRCDSISEAIVDNWLTDPAIAHEKDARYPTTHHRADWRVGGLFIEYFGLVNDSPRYMKALEEKREMCKEFGIPLIELYPDDLYPTSLLAERLRAML